MNKSIALKVRLLRGVPNTLQVTAARPLTTRDPSRAPQYLHRPPLQLRCLLLSHYEAEDIQERAAGVDCCGIGTADAIARRMQPLAGCGLDLVRAMVPWASTLARCAFYCLLHGSACWRAWCSVCTRAWSVATMAVDSVCIEVLTPWVALACARPRPPQLASKNVDLCIYEGYIKS